MTAPHLQHLNPPQYEAVTTLDGPLLILAGAGSGKTRVLTRRIAHLLHTGVSPEEILAVTFTNKAASEMKERVIELVGEPGNKVWVSTFHASCCRILREDIEALGWTRRFAIYDDDDQIRVIKDVIEQLGYDPKMVPAREVRSHIDHHKNHLRSPDDLVAEHRARASETKLRIWRGYAEALKAADAVDFNDLIGLTVRLFQEHPEVKLKWQEHFHYILVDEYQDTNQGQYQLLRLLAAGHRNLAVVGDDDQSIYGFRGADINNILGFERDYTDATVIRLEQNYRSTGNILAVANAVVRQNTERIEKALWTAEGEGPKVQFLVCTDPRSESRVVANAVLTLRRRGFTFGDMAIVYRTNATARVFETALAAHRVPYRIVGNRKFYERREVRDMLAYVRLVINPADDAAFLRVVNVPRRGIGAKSIGELRAEATRMGRPLLATSRGRAAGGSRAAKSLASFVGLIDELSQVARSEFPSALLTLALERTGYLTALRSELIADGADPKIKRNPELRKADREARGRLENLNLLLRDAYSFCADLPPGVAAMDALTMWIDRIALSGQDEEIPQGGEVTLMTVHNAKGLEYPVVFVVHMMDGHFPHAKSRERGLAEERRLAYVAFTRAKQQLVVTRSKKSRADGGREQPAEPSPFLYGLPDDACLGDLPVPEPAAAASLHAPLDQLRSTFMRQCTPPAEELVLLDVEDLSQLQRGVRVHVPEHGVGRLIRLMNRSVLVDFGGSTARIPLEGIALSLVAE